MLNNFIESFNESNFTIFGTDTYNERNIKPLINWLNVSNNIMYIDTDSNDYTFDNVLTILKNTKDTHIIIKYFNNLIDDNKINDLMMKSKTMANFSRRSIDIINSNRIKLTLFNQIYNSTNNYNFVGGPSILYAPSMVGILKGNENKIEIIKNRNGYHDIFDFKIVKRNHTLNSLLDG